MGFSGIGIWEIVLIIVVVLIVLGPHRVPEIARKLGQAIRAIKRASTDLTTAVTRELDVTQNNPSSPPKDTQTKEAPSAASKAGAEGQDDQPAKPEGHQQKNE